jgi:hypothetical protein
MNRVNAVSAVCDLHGPLFVVRSVRLTLCGGLLAAMAGCVSTGKNVTGWDEITLAPGMTGTCQSNPCRVFFQMPKGSGAYKVLGNGVTYGTYPAGQTVSLDSFFGSNVIKVPDAGVPLAYVYVPTSR